VKVEPFSHFFFAKAALLHTVSGGSFYSGQT